MPQDEFQNKIQDIYKRAIDILNELLVRQKEIMIEYKKKRDAKKIEGLKAKIKNNG